MEQFNTIAQNTTEMNVTQCDFNVIFHEENLFYTHTVGLLCLVYLYGEQRSFIHLQSRDRETEIGNWPDFNRKTFRLFAYGFSTQR